MNRSPTPRGDSLRSLLGRDWNPGDRVVKTGVLRVVEEKTGWMAAFSDKAERRDQRASVTAATIAPQYICRLDGLNFSWKTLDEASVVGSVQLDAVESIRRLGVDQSITNCISIPGYFLCAPTHGDAIDWLMALVFNCQTAHYAARYARGRHLAPPAAEDVRDVHALLNERGGSHGMRGEAVRNQEHSQRVVLGIELFRAATPGTEPAADQSAYSLLGGDHEVRVDLQVPHDPRPEVVHSWRTVHTTEDQHPKPVKTDENNMRAVSFCVMLSFCIPSAGDGRAAAALQRPIRLQVRRSNGLKAVGAPFECTTEDLVSSESGYFVHRVDRPPGDDARVWDGSDHDTGAYLGVRCFLPKDAQPGSRATGFTSVLTQSYMVPVESDRQREAGRWGMFFEGPVVGPIASTGNDGFVVTEHLQVPRVALEVPVHYLRHRIEEMRSQILRNLEETKHEAAPKSGRRVLSAEEELQAYARVGQLQARLRKTLMLLPGYSASLRFYSELLRRCEDGATAYMKTSTSKKDRDWAFVATNLCVQRLTVDCGPRDQVQAGTPLFCGITSGVHAANCEGFEFLRETGVGLLFMDQFLEQQKRLLTSVSKRSLHNQEPVRELKPDEVRPRMQTHLEESADPEQRISSTVDQLENMVSSRTDIVFSQALSSIVAGFLAMLEATKAGAAGGAGAAGVAPHRCLRLLERTGVFYIQFESLLSTRKNEKGMIEDLFHVITQRIPALLLRCERSESKSNGCLGFEPGTREGALIVRVGLSPDNFDLLPPRLVEGERSVGIQVLALLFTQGINEQQSFAHTLGESNLQDQINRLSLKRLGRFFTEMSSANALTRGADGTVAKPIRTAVFEQLGDKAAVVPPMDAGESVALQDALNLLRDAVAEADGDENKHPEVLITAERFTALAGGARVTSCKSGKDRTGMAATLEEFDALRDWLGGRGYRIAFGTREPETHLRDLLRSKGVRRDNVRLNTGNDNYAFNSLQQGFLPEMYRPPPGSYGTNIS